MLEMKSVLMMYWQLCTPFCGGRPLDYFQITLTTFIFSLSLVLACTFILFLSCTFALRTPSYSLWLAKTDWLIDTRTYISIWDWVDFPKCRKIGNWDAHIFLYNLVDFFECRKIGNWDRVFGELFFSILPKIKNWELILKTIRDALRSQTTTIWNRTEELKQALFWPKQIG